MCIKQTIEQIHKQTYLNLTLSYSLRSTILAQYTGSHWSRSSPCRSVRHCYGSYHGLSWVLVHGDREIDSQNNCNLFTATRSPLAAQDLMQLVYRLPCLMMSFGRRRH